MRKGWLLVVLGLVAASPTFGQNAAVNNPPVQTWPAPGTTAGGNVSSTITATGVFQMLWTANLARRGCTIVNESSSDTMYITESLTVGGSSQALAAALPPLGVYYCTNGGVVLTGQVNITGTSGDSFYAAQY